MLEIFWPCSPMPATLYGRQTSARIGENPLIGKTMCLKHACYRITDGSECFAFV